jgi:hypothetical protein
VDRVTAQSMGSHMRLTWKPEILYSSLKPVDSQRRLGQPPVAEHVQFESHDIGRTLPTAKDFERRTRRSDDG